MFPRSLSGKIILIAFTLMLLFVIRQKIKDIKDDLNKWNFHTTPDKWEKPREFQTPLSSSHYPWDEKIVINMHDKIDIADAEKHFSPNGAYWYSRRFSKNGTFEVTIFNEHRYIVIDTSGDDHYTKKVEWINEKLLYISDWVGRVLAIDIIYDVEKGKILYIEETNSGNIPYQQWQQAKQKNQKKL